MEAVGLSFPEFVWAVHAAVDRMVASNAKELNHATIYERDYLTRLNEEVAGACAEIALAKWAGRYWAAPLNEFHRTPDVGTSEARGTALPHGCLIVRANDPPERPYVLGILKGLEVRLMGWMWGHEARQDQWVRDPGSLGKKAWFVPQGRLRPIEHLGEMP